jgi:hypothetical protein
MQTEMQTAEPHVPQPSASGAEAAIGKLNSYKSPDADQITAEMIQAGGETLRAGIHKLIKLIWNKEELPHQRQESIVATIHKKGDKADCNNYRGMSLLSTSHKILSNILLSKLTPYADENTGNYQCGFRPNRSTTAQIFHNPQILEKNGSIMLQYISYL